VLTAKVTFLLDCFWLWATDEVIIEPRDYLWSEGEKHAQEPLVLNFETVSNSVSCHKLTAATVRGAGAERFSVTDVIFLQGVNILPMHRVIHMLRSGWDCL
jgi:hypothetical protein